MLNLIFRQRSVRSGWFKLICECRFKCLPGRPGQYQRHALISVLQYRIIVLRLMISASLQVHILLYYSRQCGVLRLYRRDSRPTGTADTFHNDGLLSSGVAVVVSVLLVQAVTGTQYDPTWESLDTRPLTTWFKRAGWAFSPTRTSLARSALNPTMRGMTVHGKTVEGKNDMHL